jgi:hypothetical protein
MQQPSDDNRMLTKLIRALMAYYGPIGLIRATLDEADRVIKEMAVTGYIKEAKEFAKVVEVVNKALV